MHVSLWSINRWLRWTGLVLVVTCDARQPDDPERVPTTLGLVFVGWPPERAWARYCARSRAEVRKPAGRLGPTPAIAAEDA